MVKLFVGGLPEGVDSIRLRQLFSQFVIVNECDVIKDYAFVHVADEESARIAIEKLDGYILENKAINIRRSTSKLRREPGMDKRCYRCGAADHKTVQCPNDPSNQNNNLKRSATGGQPITTIGGDKRFAADTTGTGTPTITINLTGRPTAETSASNQLHSSSSTYTYQQQMQPQQLANVALTAAESDPELARPMDSDLIPLYEQYMESRTKYFYFRERLSKEVKARAHMMPSIVIPQLQAPYNTSIAAVAAPTTTSTIYSMQPLQQQQQQQHQQQQHQQQLQSQLQQTQPYAQQLSGNAAYSTTTTTTPGAHFYANATPTNLYPQQPQPQQALQQHQQQQQTLQQQQQPLQTNTYITSLQQQPMVVSAPYASTLSNTHLQPQPTRLY